MPSINSHAESAFFFELVGRLRKAEPQEAEEILDTLATMRDRSPCEAIRLRCTYKILKHRGLLARIANGAIAAVAALTIGFIVEAATLDGVINCLDKIA